DGASVRVHGLHMHPQGVGHVAHDVGPRMWAHHCRSARVGIVWSAIACILMIIGGRRDEVVAR
ncbi:hypothetical protein CRG98_026077, partial [Punica granatum]